MNATVHEHSSASPVKRQRHEGGCCGEVLQDDGSRDHVHVWGVLVAQNLPSIENGLLAHTHDGRRSRVDGGDAPGTESAATRIASSSLRNPGEDWLWRHTPPALRQFYAPACSETHCTVSLSQEGDKSHASPPRLLLPLCSTRSNKGAVRLGRLANNDIVFATNPCVSSVHCTIAYQAEHHQRLGDASAAAAVAVANTVAQKVTSEATSAVDKVAAPLHRRPLLATEVPAAPPPRSGATGRNAAAEQQRPANVHVLLSDCSTNGCVVNGAKVGNGRSVRLRDGDVVELINAGPRHRRDHNLAFLFLTAEAFVRWAAKPPHEACTTQGARESISLAEKASKKEQQQRRALLCRAQWDVEAQVRRMYGHSVDEYYCLDRAHPLGQGTFGTVYRAALNADASASSQSPSLTDAGDGVAAGVPPCWQHVFGEDSQGGWMTNPLAVAQLREAYIRRKERQAPASVRHACASAASTATGKADAATTEATSQVFAVKVIRKQRMLVEVLGQLQQQQQHQHTEGSEVSADGAAVPCIHNAATIATPRTSEAVPGTITPADAAVIEQLLLMETQPDDLAAQRREEWTAAVLTRLQLADAAPASLSASSSLSAWRTSQHKPCNDGNDDFSNDGGTNSVSRQDREQRRRELIRCLPRDLRRTYERELQHRRRQQREIQILLAVRHRSITALYEVFDQQDHLALVMEQATGGEVWDLLQIYKRRERGGQAGGPKGERGALNHRLGNDTSRSPTLAETAATFDDDDDDDVDLVSVGGPLPEFIVKIIIVQVIEAVLYLHTMGIIHRDLKLENLMLQRPCDRYALNALQLQMLVHQLRAYSHLRHASAASTCASITCEDDSETVEFTNPLSVLYTVHVPRHMWPVVKVMDFGLSHVLDQLQTYPLDFTGTLHGFTGTLSQMSQDAEGRSAAVAAAATEAVPERVKLIYSRNDAKTSCGTPIYAAPEVTNPTLRPDTMGYGAAVDMYSIGVITYALLTGRAPFPTAKPPGRPGGTPVVNYDAPLRFQRHRRRPVDAGPHPPSRPSRSAAPPSPDAVCLPPLSVVESVCVELRKTRAEPAGASSAASEQTRQWRGRAEAMAASVRRSEQRRAHAGGSAGGSSATSADTIFDSTVEQLCTSLTAYADMCVSRGVEVDLDRLVYVSAEAAATDAQADDSVGRVMTSSGHVTDVLLPPISALGTSFLRGLLDKHPSQRLTAYEALQHPWLRECV